jgi:hypothetical protein
MITKLCTILRDNYHFVKLTLYVWSTITATKQMESSLNVKIKTYDGSDVEWQFKDSISDVSRKALPAEVKFSKSMLFEKMIDELNFPTPRNQKHSKNKTTYIPPKRYDWPPASFKNMINDDEIKTSQIYLLFKNCTAQFIPLDLALLKSRGIRESTPEKCSTSIDNEDDSLNVKSSKNPCDDSTAVTRRHCHVTSQNKHRGHKRANQNTKQLIVPQNNICDTQPVNQNTKQLIVPQNNICDTQPVNQNINLSISQVQTKPKYSIRFLD